MRQLPSAGFIQDTSKNRHASLEQPHGPLHIRRSRPALFDDQEQRIDVWNKPQDIGSR
jgi:hypothetical protein